MAWKDCLCCLPTGYGKSLIYEILPFLVDDCFILVIEPLIAIIKQQLTKLGDKATSLCKGISIDINNNYHYLFRHPEDILDNKYLIEKLTGDWVKKIIFLVVDEAN